MTKLEIILRERKLYGLPPCRKGGLKWVASQVGMSRNAMSRHINGKGRLSLPSIGKLARFLGVRMEDLIDQPAGE